MGKLLASIGVAALVLLGGSGCAKIVGSIQVQGVCGLPDDCTFPSGGCSEFILSRPVIDVDTARTLQLYLNVTNQLISSGNEQGGVNTNTAYVDRISTSYSFIDPGFSLAGSGSTTLGTIAPGETSTVKMYVIDEVAGTALQALAIPTFTTDLDYVDMVVHVSVEGHLVDGTEFETEPYDLAVRACNGCLGTCTTVVTCPPNADGQSPAICGAATP